MPNCAFYSAAEIGAVMFLGVSQGVIIGSVLSGTIVLVLVILGVTLYLKRNANRQDTRDTSFRRK